MDELEQYLASLTPTGAPTPSPAAAAPSPATSVSSPSPSTLDDLDSLTDYLAGNAPAAATPSPAADAPSPVSDVVSSLDTSSTQDFAPSPASSLDDYLSSLSPADEATLNASDLFATDNSVTGNQNSFTGTTANTNQTNTGLGPRVEISSVNDIHNVAGVDVEKYFNDPAYKAGIDQWRQTITGTDKASQLNELLDYHAKFLEGVPGYVNVFAPTTQPLSISDAPFSAEDLAIINAEAAAANSGQKPSGLETLVPSGDTQGQGEPVSDAGYYTGGGDSGDSGTEVAEGDGMGDIDSRIFGQDYVDPRTVLTAEAGDRFGNEFAGNFGGGFGGEGGGGGGCPAPWINITLADGGTVKAGDIKPGMMVYTRHETTGEWGNFPVTIVRKGEDTRWVILFEGGVEFVGTFNHPVMVGNAWVEIQHLKAGDKVLQPEGFAVVKSAEYFDHGPIVKIEVQDAHTYLTEGFLSHNKMMAQEPMYTQVAGDTFRESEAVAAEGGLMALAKGGSAQAFFRKGKYNFRPAQMYANGGMPVALSVGGGLGTLGGYSDGGRLLKGPGDGVSDSIPATIGQKQQPARLADGEFVVPARIVSELGNGSTDAGAKKLYAMMDRVQRARGKTTGKNKVAANSRADKYLPA
jgi:hypothetical protein